MSDVDSPWLWIDVTDMLESLVTAYFAAHPDDAPSDDLDSLFPDG